MPRRWVRRWPTWWAVMRACARCSRRPRGYLGSWWCPPRRRTLVGTSSMPPAGRKRSWTRPSAPWRVTRLTWRPRFPCRQGFSASATNEHVVVSVAHHIAADGLSMGPMVNDLGVAYVCRCAGLDPVWAELPVQYVDYTLWQRSQFGDLDDGNSLIAAQLAYWQDALAGMPDRLQLPTDRPYPPVADQRGASVSVALARRVAATDRSSGSRAQRDQFHAGSGRPGCAAG